MTQKKCPQSEAELDAFVKRQKPQAAEYGLTSLRNMARRVLEVQKASSEDADIVAQGQADAMRLAEVVAGLKSLSARVEDGGVSDAALVAALDSMQREGFKVDDLSGV